MFKKIKDQWFPKIDPEVQRVIDKRSLNNVWRICLVMFFFEAIALTVFVSTRKVFDHAAMASIKSVSFCMVLCLVGVICAVIMAQKDNVSHAFVAVFGGCYYLLLSSWAIDVSIRNYKNNEMILTFFAVQLLMVCFAPTRPVLGFVFATYIYTVLYLSLYNIDGASGINIFNYVMLLAVTITGMIVRFYSEKVASERSVELAKSYEQLFYNNRHDGLTGLRNRKALEEDVPKVINSHVSVYMIDVNYFKTINDTYGHTVGDKVLYEAAKSLKKIFADARCYRYGGDEFLIISNAGELYAEDTFRFRVPEIPDKDILLSVGHAEGDPQDHEALFRLISDADKQLYEIKARTHNMQADR